MIQNHRKATAALACGILGCICFGAGDWLMMYGNAARSSAISWLTVGTAAIPGWRNGLAMALAFPGSALYGIALFSLASFLKTEKGKTVYRYLTAFGMMPWLCLHLLYIMILYLFAWLSCNGYDTVALPAAEALFAHLSWVITASVAVMSLPFLYWFYLLLREKSVFPRWMAFVNPLILYGLLTGATLLMPDDAFRLAFTNGLMSEAMAIWFAVMLGWNVAQEKR